MEKPQPESAGAPPQPPSRTAVGTAEMSPKPSKEQIVALLKGMNQYDLRWVLNEIQKVMRSNVDRNIRGRR